MTVKFKAEKTIGLTEQEAKHINYVTFLINNIINVLKDDKDFIECDSNYTGLSYYWKDDLKKVCETLENLCGNITVCNEREVEP